jgi:crotonobetainyl-CoA:carnitine CoA-transferase CaiB-like acyl-CoA transferase
MNQILKGIKVLELSSVLAGPAVGMFLAELGAEVVKIEPPSGDVTRTWKLGSEDESSTTSAYFSSINYLKTYLRKDLKAPQELKDVQQLAAGSDVILANFRGTRGNRFGLDYATLSQENKDLIYCELHGFPDDPDRAAYDLVLQAETGWMSMNGTADSGPLKMPVALMDVLAAHHMKQAILIALFHRERTRSGAWIKCSLQESSLSNLVNQSSNYLMAGAVAELRGSLHPNIAPYGETFTCSCGKAIVLAVGSDHQFQSMCQLIGAHELIVDERFSSNQDRLLNRASMFTALKPYFEKSVRTELLAKFHDHGVPAGAVLDMRDALSTPAAQRLIREEIIDGQPTKRLTSLPFDFTSSIV